MSGYPNVEPTGEASSSADQQRKAYPNVLPEDEIHEESSWLTRTIRSAAEQHSIELDIAPLRAHRNAAFFGLAVASVFSVGRGLLFACTCPPRARLAGFFLMAQSALPFYAIPFTIGLQVRTNGN